MKRARFGLQGHFLLASTLALLVVLAIVALLLQRQSALQRETDRASHAVIHELCLRLTAGERWKGTLQMKVDGQLRETEWQISPYRRAELSLVFVEDVTEHRHRERHDASRNPKTLFHRLTPTLARAGGGNCPPAPRGCYRPNSRDGSVPRSGRRP